MADYDRNNSTFAQRAAARSGKSVSKAENKAVQTADVKAAEHACEVCGFVAKSASGIAAHARIHQGS